MKNELKQWIEQADEKELGALLEAQEALPLPKEASYHRLKKQVLLKCGLRRERGEMHVVFKGISLCACIALAFFALLAAQGMVQQPSSNLPGTDFGNVIDPGIASLGDSDEGVDAFLERFESYNRQPGVCSCGADMDTAMEHCRNVTPKDVAEKNDVQIFKFSCNHDAYHFRYGQIGLLHDGLGGSGLLSMVLCDFDENGVQDLLYTASGASGLQRSEIWWLDLTEKSRMELAAEENGIFFDNIDIYLSKTTKNGAVWVFARTFNPPYYTEIFETVAWVVRGTHGLPIIVGAEGNPYDVSQYDFAALSEETLGGATIFEAMEQACKILEGNQRIAFQHADDLTGFPYFSEEPPYGSVLDTDDITNSVVLKQFLMAILCEMVMDRDTDCWVKYDARYDEESVNRMESPGIVFAPDYVEHGYDSALDYWEALKNGKCEPSDQVYYFNIYSLEVCRIPNGYVNRDDPGYVDLLEPYVQRMKQTWFTEARPEVFE